MPIDTNVLGEKLKRYREQFSLTFPEVAQATGVNEQRLKELETGSRFPSGDEILILAAFYKCDYKFFVSNERLAAFEETETLFRRYGEEFSKQDRWAVQEFLFLSECESFLQAELGKEPRNAFRFQKQGTSFKKHGEEAAARLRLHLGYTALSVSLDIYKDFRAVGIHVFRRKLENSNISGLYLKHPIAGNCILVNYSEDVYGQRFTAAHEAGHAILDSDDSFIVSFSFDKRKTQEIRANTFAAHYLAPSSFLKAIPESHKWNQTKAIEWANKLKVSTEVLAYALSREKLITSNTVELIKSVRVPKRDKTDPEIPPTLSPKSQERKRQLLEAGLSNYYVNLCFQAYRDSLISASRLTEMLLLESNSALRALAALYGEHLQYGS